MFHEVLELERFQSTKNDLQGHSRALAIVPFYRTDAISS